MSNESVTEHHGISHSRCTISLLCVILYIRVRVKVRTNVKVEVKVRVMNRRILLASWCPGCMIYP